MPKKESKIPPCPICGMKFDTAFDAVDHMMEDEQDFDPALLLPGGFKLMVGSLLRCIFEHADDPDMIRDIVQSTYMTLFAAEFQDEAFEHIVHDLVVATTMADIDDELEKILKTGE